MVHPEGEDRALIPGCVSVPPAAAYLRTALRGARLRTGADRRDLEDHGPSGASVQSAYAGSPGRG